MDALSALASLVRMGAYREKLRGVRRAGGRACVLMFVGERDPHGPDAENDADGDLCPPVQLGFPDDRGWEDGQHPVRHAVQAGGDVTDGCYGDRGVALPGGGHGIVSFPSKGDGLAGEDGDEEVGAVEQAHEDEHAPDEDALPFLVRGCSRSTGQPWASSSSRVGKEEQLVPRQQTRAYPDQKQTDDDFYDV